MQDKKIRTSSVPNSVEGKSYIVQEKRCDKPKQLNILNAKTVLLPKLKFEPDYTLKENSKQFQNAYWKKYNAASSYYKRGSYKKAKEEFLKIYNWDYNSEQYFIILLRTYRKILNGLMVKEKYDKALFEFDEMFDNCNNTTNIDVKNYNKLVDILRAEVPNCGILPREIMIDTQPRFNVDSKYFEFIADCKKPRGFKTFNRKELSIDRLKEHSNYLPDYLSYLEFDGSGAEYVTQNVSRTLNHDVYRFRESRSRNTFITSTKDLSIYLYNWKLDLQYSFDATKYSESYYHLRQVDISSDDSLFLFTNIDRVFLMDSTFSIFSSWEVPHKVGWERKRNDSSYTRLDYLTLFSLDKKSSFKEIKASFRKLAKIHHPDRNPHDPLAESKMKQLIEAYEYLTDEKAVDAFKEKGDEKWVKTIHDLEFEVMGLSVSIDISFGGAGEDWIYGSGVSNNGNRIYLGCYSGKTYQMNSKGFVEKIYVIPEDNDGRYGKTNPVTFVVECENYLHIMTHWYLYILKDETVLKFLKIDKRIIKWFDRGFIQWLKNEVHIYLSNGNLIGYFHFKDSIRHICYKDGIFLFKTGKGAFVFKLKI